MQQFENYRQQYKQILNAQMELLDSKAYSLPPYEPINIEMPALEDTANTEDLSPVFEEAEHSIEERIAENTLDSTMEEVSLADTKRIFEGDSPFMETHLAGEEEAAEASIEDDFEIMDI
jgi:hypothetical protein